MLLTTKAQYGLRALVHLAQSGHSSTQTIAQHEGIAPRYLEEIVGELRRAGLIIGKRGPRGGYRLARPPADIAIAEVLQALQPAHPAQDLPPGSQGLAEHVVCRVEARLQAALGDLRLDELLYEARDQHRRHAANYVI